MNTMQRSSSAECSCGWVCTCARPCACVCVCAHVRVFGCVRERRSAYGPSACMCEPDRKADCVWGWVEWETSSLFGHTAHSQPRLPHSQCVGASFLLLDSVPQASLTNQRGSSPPCSIIITVRGEPPPSPVQSAAASQDRIRCLSPRPSLIKGIT